MLSVTPADSLLLRPSKSFQDRPDSGDELPQGGQVSEELTPSSSVDCQSQLLEKENGKGRHYLQSGLKLTKIEKFPKILSAPRSIKSIKRPASEEFRRPAVNSRK